MPVISSTASTNLLILSALTSWPHFLQRADSARSCQVSEIQLTGGSLLQLDQCRDQPTSFGVWYPAHPPALHLAGRLCQQACCSSRQLADG